jgi:hypothetical protein
MNTRRNTRKSSRKSTRKQNGGGRKSTCKQSHVLVRTNCTTYRRVVQGTKNKTIKMGGRNVPLSSLRGKFRYLSGPLRRRT